MVGREKTVHKLVTFIDVPWEAGVIEVSIWKMLLQVVLFVRGRSLRPILFNSCSSWIVQLDKRHSQKFQLPLYLNPRYPRALWLPNPI